MTFFKDHYKVSQQSVEGDIVFYQGGEGLHVVSQTKDELIAYQVIELQTLSETARAKKTPKTERVAKTENFIIEFGKDFFTVLDPITFKLKEKFENVKDIVVSSEDDFILFKTKTESILKNLQTGY